MYLENLRGRPMELPDWAAERAKREKVADGPATRDLEAALGVSLREYVRRTL